MVAWLKQKFAILLLFSALVCIFSSCEKFVDSQVSEETFLLDTIIKITIYEGGSEEDIKECFALCRKYEKMFSRTIENSEISQINSRKISQVSDETTELIKLALDCAELTEGAVDITIEPVSALWDFKSKPPALPNSEKIAEAVKHVGYEKVIQNGNTITFSDKYTRLDLGAIAKGYIADKLKEYLVSAGVTSAIINLGGNIQCIGQKSGKEKFGIGIQYPFKNESIAIAQIADMSMVTSGIYERYFKIDDIIYHHLLNPQTGLPVENNLLSVTIFCENSAIADALSTACFVLGYEKGFELIDDLDYVHAAFITADNEVHLTRDFESHIDISIIK